MATSPCVICQEELRSWEGKFWPCCNLKVCDGPCFEKLIQAPVPGGSGRRLGDTCPGCRTPIRGTREDFFSLLMTRGERGSGGAAAQRRLADMYYHGEGVRQDMTEAARLYQNAADQEDAQAQCQLSLMIRRGEGGLKKDDEAAAQLYRRSAAQGYSHAQSNLGLCYYYGDGVPRDHAMAACLFRTAADQDCADAQFRLGACHAYGDGVPHDLIAAVHWLRRAVKQNNEHAREALSEVEANLRCSHCSGAAPAGGPQLLVCLCRSAAYCDKDCQRKLWKSHKQTCRRLVTANVEAARHAGRPSAAPEMVPCPGDNTDGDNDSGGGGGGSVSHPTAPTDVVPSSPQVTTAIAPGARVELHGLQKAPELNGKSGVVERWDAQQERWQVRIDGDPKPRGLRSGNLSVS